jgi:hypothetical protein
VTTTHLSWGASRHFDIHVLRGETSRRLDEILSLNQHDGTNPSAAQDPRPGDVLSVEFQPLLRATVTGRFVEAHGVRVNIDNGQVEALTPPARRVSNFLVEARVLIREPAGTQRFLDPVRIRVHVHRTLNSAWLTPTPLSIREGAPGQRFSVLAEFDEGVSGQAVRTVGDISTHPAIEWDVSDASVDINDAGEMAGTVQAGTPLVTVTAQLPQDLTGATATGQVRVLDRWNGQPADVRAARLVAGPASKLPPGPARLANATNVLFLSEGFLPGERDLFEQVASEVVRQLRTSPGTNPYKLLRDSINYWWAFLPSPPQSAASPPHAGLTTLYELDLVRRGNRLIGQEVPQPQPPGAGTASSAIEELVHLVGLPTPADVTGNLEADLTRKRADWIELFGFDINAVTPEKRRRDLFKAWRGLSDRRLANERDTVLGVKLGERPAVERRSEPRGARPNPRRTTRAHLDQFLATLTDGPGGPVIGAAWNSRPSPPGPDHSHVIALCAGGRAGGAATLPDPDTTRLIALTLVDTNDVPLQAVAGSPMRLDVRPHPVPRKASGDVRISKPTLARVAHELAHALRIGDEYGGRASVPDRELDRARAMRNLQPTVDAEVRTPGDPQPLLVGEKVKWRWPLLLRAGKTTGPPVPEGGGLFSVELLPGHGGQFVVGDLVRLRKPLPDGTAQDGLSGPLEVVLPDADVLILEVKGGTLTPAAFPAGSVVCEPAPARPSARASGDEHAELLDEAIRTYLNVRNQPLSRTQASCLPDVRKVQHPRHLPDGLPKGRPRFRAQIVGLYEGGDDYYCGLMHPTGMCIMRTYTMPDSPGTLTGFCLVCQYALVDRLDARKHAALARLFKNKDAQP